MILVTGATGLIGRHLVARLLKENLPVRVLLPIREGQEPDLPWPEPVPVVAGSVEDPEALHRAMTDVHTVFHLASAQWWGRRRDLTQIELEGSEKLIVAARANRVGRIIMMSHLGAAPSSAFPLMRVKGQVEELIRSSGLAYTIIRSGVVFGPEDRFVNGIAVALRTNPFIFFQPGRGEGLLHPIFIDDLIGALVASLEALHTVDQILEVGGPEYLTFNEMVRTVMRVSHAPRTVVSLPPYFLRSATDLMRRIFPRWPITAQWYDMLASNRTAPLGNLYNTFGIRPVRFEDTLLTYMPHRHYRAEMARALLRRRVGHA